MILIDAEKECPLELARSFFDRINALGTSRPVVIAFAKCMYENWFLASIETMQGQELPEGRLGIKSGTQPPEDIEGQTGAKGWLTAQMPRGIAYKETIDQVALTQMMDIELVYERSRSFRRLCNAVTQAINGIEEKQVFVTPSFVAESENIPVASGDIKAHRKLRSPK